MKRWQDCTMSVAGMDTIFSWNTYGTGDHSTNLMVGEMLSRMEAVLSRYKIDSDVARINRNAGIAGVEVSDDTMVVVNSAITCSQVSQGHFDITVGPLIDLWDIPHAHTPPDSQAVETLLPLVDYRRIIIFPDRNYIGLEDPCASIDLGGIAKGYAANKVRTLWKTHGVTSAFLDLGGNVSTLGNRPDGSMWRVGIRHPRIPDTLLAVLHITNRSVVTSGDYERYFIDSENNRWHHILDPTTGYPACSDLISATVVHTDAMVADALATTIMVMGSESVLRLLTYYADAQVCLVDNTMRIWVSEGLIPHLQPMVEVKELIILEERGYANAYK